MISKIIRNLFTIGFDGILFRQKVGEDVYHFEVILHLKQKQGYSQITVGYVLVNVNTEEFLISFSPVIEEYIKDWKMEYGKKIANSCLEEAKKLNNIEC